MVLYDRWVADKPYAAGIAAAVALAKPQLAVPVLLYSALRSHVSWHNCIVSTLPTLVLFALSLFAYGDWMRFTENDFVYKELEMVEREMTLRPEIELITDFWTPLAALLYTRTIANKIGGWNTALPVIQDARYALDAAIHQAKFIYTPGVMGYYRVHETGSLSTRNRFNFMNDCPII